MKLYKVLDKLDSAKHKVFYDDSTGYYSISIRDITLAFMFDEDDNQFYDVIVYKTVDGTGKVWCPNLTEALSYLYKRAYG